VDERAPGSGRAGAGQGGWRERGSPAPEHWGSARVLDCPCQPDKENNNQEKSLLELIQTLLLYLQLECLLLLLLIFFFAGCCVSAEIFVAQMAPGNLCVRPFRNNLLLQDSFLNFFYVTPV